MPRVRILSGSESGTVVEMSQPEAESAIGCGYAEAFVEPTPTPRLAPPPKADKPTKSKG